MIDKDDNNIEVGEGFRLLAIGERVQAGDDWYDDDAEDGGWSPTSDPGTTRAPFNFYRRAVRLTPDGGHRYMDVGERRDLPGAEDSYTHCFSGVVTWERDPRDSGDRFVEFDRYHRVPWPPPEASDAKPERCPIPGCVRAPGHVGYHASAAPEASDAKPEPAPQPKGRAPCGCGLHDIDPTGDVNAQHREWNYATRREADDHDPEHASVIGATYGIGASAPPPPLIACDDMSGDDIAADWHWRER